MLPVDRNQTENARHSLISQTLENAEIVLLFGTGYVTAEQDATVVQSSLNILPPAKQARTP
jgi:hypothetical protein